MQQIIVDSRLLALFQTCRARSSTVFGSSLIATYKNHQGKLTIHFSEEGAQTEMSVDLPFPYDPSFPDTVMAYDDGESQTILLPEEGHRES